MRKKKTKKGKGKEREKGKGVEKKGKRVRCGEVITMRMGTDDTTSGDVSALLRLINMIKINKIKNK